MPTIEDIASDIKGTLLQINQHTVDTATAAAAIKNDTVDIKATLHAIGGTLTTGFAVVEDGLFALLEAAKLNNSLALANVEQNKTIICWLGKIADLLCRENRKLNTLIDIEGQTRTAIVKLELVQELVHARETLEVDRMALVEARMDACCPPQQPDPEFCYEPCPTPEIRPYSPKGQDWHPPRNQDGPR